MAFQCRGVCKEPWTTHAVITCIEALLAGSKTACQARLPVICLVIGHFTELANSCSEPMRRQTCTDESIARGKGDHSK